IRHDLDPVEGRGNVQRPEPAGLRNSPLAVEGTAPEAPLERTTTAAAEVDAPDLAPAGGVPNGRQGKAELRRPPVVRAPGGRLPRRVPTRLHIAPVVRNASFRLGAQRVRDEVVPGTPLERGSEYHR